MIWLPISALLVALVVWRVLLSAADDWQQAQFWG